MKKENREELPLCDSTEVHRDRVERQRNTMPSMEVLFELSDFFKVLGDTTRMRILFAIDREPLCVCDISELLGMTKSAVSHQLRILRQNDLVTYRRMGKNVYYALADDHVRDMIETALVHIQEP